jgi:hypothetical protein
MEVGKYIRRRCGLHWFGLGETSSGESESVCDSSNVAIEGLRVDVAGEFVNCTCSEFAHVSKHPCVTKCPAVHTSEA